jgi:hypothetical protein
MQIKKAILVIIFVFCYASNIIAQNARTHKSHSIKGPILGLSYSYEHPVSPQSVINFELMATGGWSTFMNETAWIIGPSFRVEPRYYYNLKRRFQNDKKTKNNSANYLAFSVDYAPGIGFGKDAEIDQYFMFAPKYGLKRTIGRHFIFELAAGIGGGIIEDEGISALIVFDLKLGYAF